MSGEAVEHGDRDRHRPQARLGVAPLAPDGGGLGELGGNQSQTGISSGGGTFTSVTRLR